MKYFCILFCLLTIISSVHLDQFIFPEDTPVTQKTKSNTRAPLSNHMNCPNEKYWYYPVGDKDWLCDCKPAHIYYPQKDDCFVIYRQGPCNSDQYLILPENKITPECVANPCKKDQQVKFKNKCQKLYTDSPCQQTAPGKVLDVNTTTLELACIAAGSVGLSIIDVPNIPCPKGSRRRINGTCRDVIPT